MLWLCLHDLFLQVQTTSSHLRGNAGHGREGQNSIATPGC